MATILQATMASDLESSSSVFRRPARFNFAIDVVDYWASQTEDMNAMHWVSQDESTAQILTYRYFSRRSERIAILLEQLGVQEGETMIMILPRIPTWWEMALAAIRKGVILSPAPILCTSSDIHYRCNQSAAACFVGDADSIEKFLKVRSGCTTVRTIIQVGGLAQDGVTLFHPTLESIGMNERFNGTRRPWNSPALTYFTSGTSGSPKMVRHNQVSYPFALRNTARSWYQLSPGKMIWNTAEQGWAKAAWSFFGAWSCGATIFVYDDRGSFDAQRILRMLNKYPINTLCAPPLAYRQLVLEEAQQYMKNKPPIALTHCTSAGEALNADVSQKWRTITGHAIHEGYGQTETVLLCGHFAGSRVRPGSMGRPAPGVPLYVINPEGEEAEVGAEGDIAVLLGNPDDDATFFGLFDGYATNGSTFQRRDKVVEIKGKTKSWYLTGDRATRDADGYFWFVGRADDVINSSGYRIGPFEVESTLKLHPAVTECAVTSSPDRTRGEVVKAFVALASTHRNADQQKLKKELQEFCKTNAAPYKYPRKIDFVTDFPKTSSGKIQRSKLRQMEWKADIKSKL